MKKFIGLMIVCFAGLISTAHSQETALQYSAEGNQFYVSKNYVESEKSYRNAIKADPGFAAAHQGLGNVCYVQGRTAEAMAEYQVCLTLQPDNASLKAFVQSQPASQTVSASPTPSFSQPVPSETINLDQAHAIFGIFGGPALGVNGFNNGYVTYGLGAGAGLFVGCQFDRHFSVELHLAQYSFSYSETYQGFYGPATFGESDQEWELMTVCKYIIGTSGVRPYVGIGLGSNLTVQTPSGSAYNYATIEPMFEFGLGVIVPLNRQWDFFVEGYYDVVIYDQENDGGNISYIPINAGFKYNAL